MSTQRGSNVRSRPQKHQNRSVFKNNLHDTSHRTKQINSLQVSDVCEKCKNIIEWKIKYKKYKPLTHPKTCVKCNQKKVTKAYHVMCRECGKNLAVCTKCCQPKDIVQSVPDAKEEIKLDNELQALLQSLPERKRRTFLRYMNKKGKDETSTQTQSEKRDDLVKKLNELDIADDRSDDDDFDDSDMFNTDGSDESD